MPTQVASRDPIKFDPLREPGESLKEKRLDILMDQAFPWLAIAMTMCIVAMFEWVQWATSLPPQPIAMTIVAVGTCALTASRFRKLLPELKRLRLAIRGEQHVGQFLQRDVVPLGYQVFHDICEDGCNIDHVAIGPGGVFSIETKTHSKSRGDSRVLFDGGKVTIDGHIPDRDPIAQARACATSLRRILKEYSGIDERPRPVVLYPGWYVESQSTDVWVLNENRFAGFLRNERDSLSRQQVDVLSAALARYIRDRRRKDEVG